MQVQNLRVEGQTLYADVVRGSELKHLSYNLDNKIGNIDGNFEWRAEGFSRSACEIRLNNTVLTARLRTRSGNWNSSTIDLNGKIYVSNDLEFSAFNDPVQTLSYNVSVSTG